MPIMRLDTCLATKAAAAEAAERSAGQPAPIDRAHLARYTLGDAALEREILELFLGHLPNTIRDLGLAETDKDWHMAAHALKGSARAVGAWRLAREAEAAERLGGLADRAAVDAVIARIADASVEVSSHIATLVAAM